MKYLKGLRPSGSMVVAIIALIAACTGTAVAAATISGSDLVNDTVASKKVKDRTLKSKDFSAKAKKTLQGSTGAQGPAGPRGQAGPAGEAGPQGPTGPASAATYTNPEWSQIDRNTIGSPVEALRAGPIVGPAANQKPPFGIGSLGLEVNSDPAGTTNFGTEKASFGNQVDFANQDVASITALGFHVFTTGENSGKGNPNMPSISMEIDPNLTAAPTSNYSTLVFTPGNSTANQWSGYIDATTAPAAASGTGFILSGAAGTATGCNLAKPCTFTEVQDALDDGGDAAKISFSVAVTKGRDFSFQGAVDGLRINGTVYDFEPFGVQETTP